MNKDLLVICPTRERPVMCARMVKSFDEKTSKKADLIFIIDHDDKNLADYNHLFKYSNHFFYVRHQESVTEAYNKIVVDLCPGYKYYSETNDDFIYRTGNWDRILIKRLREKGGGIAYGNDGYAGPVLPTTSIISGNIIEALGWIHMPTLGFLYNDMVWKEIGQQLNRLFYIPEVEIEHLHPYTNKSIPDETHKRTNSPESYAADHKAFKEWRKLNMMNDLEKIKCVL